MMSAHPPFVKSGQVGVVDQAPWRASRRTCRLATGHEGRGKTGHRHHGQVHPHFLKVLGVEPAGEADRDTDLTRLIALPGRSGQELANVSAYLGGASPVLHLRDSR